MAVVVAVVMVIVVEIAIAVALVVADREDVALTAEVLVVLIILKTARAIVSRLVAMAVQAIAKVHAVVPVKANVPRIVRPTAIFNVRNNVQHYVEKDINQCGPKDVEQDADMDALTGVLRCLNFKNNVNKHEKNSFISPTCNTSFCKCTDYYF